MEIINTWSDKAFQGTPLLPSFHGGSLEITVPSKSSFSTKWKADFVEDCTRLMTAMRDQ